MEVGEHKSCNDGTIGPLMYVEFHQHPCNHKLLRINHPSTLKWLCLKEILGKCVRNKFSYLPRLPGVACENNTVARYQESPPPTLAANPFYLYGIPTPTCPTHRASSRAPLLVCLFIMQFSLGPLGMGCHVQRPSAKHGCEAGCMPL